MLNKRIFRQLPLLGFVSLIAAGCQVLPDKALSVRADQVIYEGFNGPPRVRYGTYPILIVGTPFLGQDVGKHSYQFTLAEKNGVAYTCRGGHVDIIHVRIAADWTSYLVARTYQHLMNNEAGFSYKLAVDRSRSYIRFTYPANWRSLPPQERSAIAREVALAVGPYLAFTMTTWHEIITWFGFKCIGLPTEFPSAFSWEDSYSNLLGTVVAVKALQDSKHSYNEAVTIAIDEELKKLGVQPARVARQASRAVKGDWYTGEVVLMVDIKMRNFDIGLRDGHITPTLVPNVAGCSDAEPLSYPVPNLDVLSQYGFGMSLQIEPHEWERGKPLQIAHAGGPGKRITPERDFAPIMDYICERAAVKWGPQYGAAQEQQQQRLYTAK